MVSTTELTCYTDGAQQLGSNINRLMDASRTADGLSKALQKIRTELNKQEYAESILPSQDLDPLYNAAIALYEHHQQSVEKLAVLTDSLGLSRISLPDELSEEEREYVKHLIMIQALRGLLWTKLQAYQDDFSQIANATTTRRHRRNQLIGTKRLNNHSEAAKARAKMVIATVDRYNRIVTDLMRLPLPAWMTREAVPQVIDRAEILRVDADDEVWEQLFAAAHWGPEDVAAAKKSPAPAFIRTPAVRKAIRHVLNKDRVAEERQRLDVEAQSMIHVLADEIAITWAARDALGVTSHLRYRLGLYLWDLLELRPPPRYAPHHWLWYCNSADAFRRLQAESPEGSLCSSSNESVGGTDSSMPILVPRDVIEWPRAADIDGDQSVDATTAWRQDEELRQRLEAYILDDGGPTDVRPSINPRLRWQQLTQNLPPLSTVLPPIRILLNAVDFNTTRVHSDEPFYAWRIAMHAVLSSTSFRSRADDNSRYYGPYAIPPALIATTNSRRHVHPLIVHAYLRILCDEVEQHPLSAAFGNEDRPPCWIVEAGCQHLSVQQMLHVFSAVSQFYVSLQPVLNSKSRHAPPDGTWQLQEVNGSSPYTAHAAYVGV